MNDLVELRYRRIGIPRLFWGKTLEDYCAVTEAQRDVVAWCLKFAEGVPTSYRSGLFVGGPGTGKTHLASAIAWAVAQRLGAFFREFTGEYVERVAFIRTGDLFRRVKDTWADKNRSEGAVLQRALAPRLLVLDEIGAQAGSEWEQQQLFDILDDRYSDQKPTLLVSNLTLVGVRQVLGERVMDRLREQGTEAQVFDWESYRGKTGTDATGAIP